MSSTSRIQSSASSRRRPDAKKPRATQPARANQDKKLPAVKRDPRGPQSKKTKEAHAHLLIAPTAPVFSPAVGGLSWGEGLKKALVGATDKSGNTELPEAEQLNKDERSQDKVPQATSAMEEAGWNAKSKKKLPNLDAYVLSSLIGGGAQHSAWKLQGHPNLVMRISSTRNPKAMQKELARLNVIRKRLARVPDDVRVIRPLAVGLHHGYLATLWTRAPGTPLYRANESYEIWSDILSQLAGMTLPDAQKYVSDFRAIQKEGLKFDMKSQNLVRDGYAFTFSDVDIRAGSETRDYTPYLVTALVGISLLKKFNAANQVQGKDIRNIHLIRTLFYEAGGGGERPIAPMDI